MMASWEWKNSSENESSSTPSDSKHSGDRFIPNRSAMDFDMAFYLLTQTKKEREKDAAMASHPGQTHGKLPAERLLPERTRILVFQARPAASSSTAEEITFDHQTNSTRQRRKISRLANQMMFAPDMADEYYLN